MFLPGDLLKAAIATAIVMTLVRGYPRAFRRASGWTTAPRDVAGSTAP